MSGSMRFHQEVLHLPGHGRGMTDITRETAGILHDSGIADGMVHLFVRHTSCSLLIQENADPEVQSDLERFLSRLVPDGEPLFRHTAEGPDDMPAHVRAALTATSLSIPAASGRLLLGTWQGIYLYEHRVHRMERRIVISICGV